MTVGQYNVAINAQHARELNFSAASIDQNNIGLDDRIGSSCIAVTMIRSANGARTSAATRAHLQRVKLGHANRKIEPSLPLVAIGAPDGEIGNDRTIAQASSRNIDDPITVGDERLTVGQLNDIVAHAKAPRASQRLR